MKLEKEFRKKLEQLIGKKCWSSIAGEGTGSHVSINFGKKVKMKEELSNKNLSEEERKYDGEIILFLDDCAWRLDSNKEVICSSTDDNRKGAPMLKGLEKLIDQKVISFDLYEPGYDLTLEFTNSLKLKLFCDQTNSFDEADNYFIFIGDFVYTVGTRSKLIIEKREEV